MCRLADLVWAAFNGDLEKVTAALKEPEVAVDGTDEVGHGVSSHEQKRGSKGPLQFSGRLHAPHRRLMGGPS